MGCAGFPSGPAVAGVARSYGELLVAARARSSERAYGSARAAFLAFRVAMGVANEGELFELLTPDSVNEAVIAGFVAWLATERKLAPNSVDAYVSGVVSSLSLLGSFGDGSALRGHRVQLALRGVANSFADRQRPARLALTMDNLADCWALLESGSFPSGEGVAGCCALAVLFWSFFGFFRISELVWTQDSGRGLRLRDVWASGVPERVSAGCLEALLHAGDWIVELDRAKCDQSGRGRATAIGALGGRACPARAFRRYLNYRRDRFGARAELWRPDCALFLMEDGSKLTYEAYHRSLRSIGVEAGLPGGDGYCSHSGRIGAASAAEAADVPRSAVKAAGNWRGDPADMGYVRSAVSERVRVQKAMAEGKVQELLEPSRCKVRKR